jgi:uncharacterized membrane protein YkoI
MKLFYSYAALSAAILFSVNASAGETTVAMKDLPVPVQKAIQEQSKGATLRGLSKEVEDGKTEYEAELTVNGHGKDISFDRTGTVVSVEEEVKLEAVPAAARSAIEKASQGGTLRKVEAVTENGKTFYEASIRKNGKSMEFQVDSNGARVK